MTRNIVIGSLKTKCDHNFKQTQHMCCRVRPPGLYSQVQGKYVMIEIKNTADD